MSESNLMCRVITPYICPVCGKPTLFFLNKFNKLIDYKALIDRQTSLYGIKNYLSANNARCIKCIECNQEYIIDWSNDYPTILTDLDKLNKFKKINRGRE